jgi:pimeloyl-ACP methyl ester carboxylesterase
MQNSSAQVEIVDIQANGFTFRCRTCGLSNTGDPVILLHGFPETSHMWINMMQYLAEQGYRCIAPDQRGYSPGARPEDVNKYSIDKIASDVISLANYCKFSKFHLVAHDWGAGCGWTVVELYADRVQSLTALSIPHMEAFEHAKKTDCEQKQKSWYMGFFQIPIIPEVMFGLITRLVPSLCWKFSMPIEIKDYLSVFRTFEGRKAILNWYRANRKLPITFGDVSLPTCFIWGNEDIAVARAGVEATKQFMTGEYSLVELRAGHTLVQEQFECIKCKVLDHIKQHPIRL